MFLNCFFSLGNESGAESNSEDKYHMEDIEHSVVVDAKHSLLNKFSFLKKPQILKNPRLTFWEHFDYLHSKYVNKSSDRQINISSALSRRHNKVTIDDCDFENIDFTAISSDVYRSINMDDARSPLSTLHNDDLNAALYASGAPSNQPNITSANSNTNTITPHPLPRDVSTGDGTSLAPESATGNYKSGRVGIKMDDADSDGGTSPGNQTIPPSLDLKQPSRDDDDDNNNNMSNKSGRGTYSNVPTTPSRSRRATKNLTGVPMVLKLIDDTRKELWKLMQDSFVRFRSTDQYIEYLRNTPDRNKSVSAKK